jgi:hypothetical protein
VTTTVKCGATHNGNTDSKSPKQLLTAAFGNKHHVVLAIPAQIRQALTYSLSSVGLIKPWEDCTPGTLKADQVALVEAVAYLKDLVDYTEKGDAHESLWGSQNDVPTPAPHDRSRQFRRRRTTIAGILNTQD